MLECVAYIPAFSVLSRSTTADDRSTMCREWFPNNVGSSSQKKNIRNCFISGANSPVTDWKTWSSSLIALWNCSISPSLGCCVKSDSFSSASQCDLTARPCGVPKKSIANVDTNMSQRCSTLAAVRVEEYMRLFFTNTPPRPWQMKIIGFLNIPEDFRSA